MSGHRGGYRLFLLLVMEVMFASGCRKQNPESKHSETAYHPGSDPLVNPPTLFVSSLVVFHRRLGGIHLSPREPFNFSRESPAGGYPTVEYKLPLPYNTPHV